MVFDDRFQLVRSFTANCNDLDPAGTGRNGNGESKAGAIGLAISDDEGLSWRRVKHGE